MFPDTTPDRARVARTTVQGQRGPSGASNQASVQIASAISTHSSKCQTRRSIDPIAWKKVASVMG